MSGEPNLALIAEFQTALARFDADLERALGFRSEATLRWESPEEIRAEMERRADEAEYRAKQDVTRLWRDPLGDDDDDDNHDDDDDWGIPAGGLWALAWPGSKRESSDLSITQALDFLQDDVLSDCRVAWPECPRHRSHPMRIVERDGDYWWQCRSDATFAIALGRFGLDL